MLVGLAAIFIVLLVGVAKHHAVADQLHSWKILSEPERLTEVYFADHDKLPRTYVPGQPLSFAFITHNLEDRTTAYHYTVEQRTADGEPIKLGSGAFTLQNNVSHKETLSITPTDIGRSYVRVTVQPGSEVINFWMDRG